MLGRVTAPSSHRDPRVGLSLERTLLAWVRTGVALVGLGIVLAKFVFFLQKLGVPTHGTSSTVSLGVALVVAGALLVTLAGIRHVRALQRWRRGEDLGAGSAALAVAVVAVVVAGAVYAVLTIVR